MQFIPVCCIEPLRHTLMHRSTAQDLPSGLYNSVSMTISFSPDCRALLFQVILQSHTFLVHSSFLALLQFPFWLLYKGPALSGCLSITSCLGLGLILHSSTIPFLATLLSYIDVSIDCDLPSKTSTQFLSLPTLTPTRPQAGPINRPKCPPAHRWATKFQL